MPALPVEFSNQFVRIQVFSTVAAMPFGLLTNKFSPKKGTPRKSPSLSNLNLDSSTRTTELGVDYGPIKLKLGSNEMLFDGGEWISGMTRLQDFNRFFQLLC